MPATKSLHLDLRKNEQSNRYYIEEILDKDLNPNDLDSLKKLGFFDDSSIDEITLGEGNHVSYTIPSFKAVFSSIPRSKVEFNRFLNLALMATKSIATVHRAGFCFGLLNEDRFLIAEDGQLINIGLAAIRKDYNTLITAEQGKSVYRYLAPEFNSRSNQKPDYRADFYGLGILLNFWLTGSYFVDAADEQGIMHQHLTKNYTVPENCYWHTSGIYQIISGLLRKNPKERYQSTDGIIKDLITLQTHLDSGENPMISELSVDHNPGVLHSDAILFERESELKQLAECYEETQEGGVSIAFIESGEGFGKTTLVNEFKKTVLDTEACFFHATADQFQASDYLAFHLAFQDVVQRLLMKTGRSHAELSNTFKNGVGTDLSLLFNVIPDLKELTGFTDTPEQLNPIETQNRFLNVFVRYCGTLGKLGLKRVLFFDDAQWFDEPSINLIRYLTKSQISGVMFILAYNNKYISADHPLQKLKNDLHKSEYKVQNIQLNTLSKSATHKVVAKMVLEESDCIHDLSKSIYNKTLGNPQQIKNLIHSLYNNNVLYYNEKEHKWDYNLNEVKLQEVRGNVVEHIEQQIKLQSYQSQVLLKIAAYNNGIFNIPLLAVVGDTAPQIITLLLDVLSDAGLLTKLDPIHGTYVFNHNRIQKVALELTIPGFDFTQEQLHHKIALYKLHKNTIQHSVELNQFVKHLIEAKELLSLESVQKVMPLIVKAGEVANASNSPASAKQYFEFGLDLATKFNVQEFSFAMLYGLAKAHFLMKDIEKGNLYANKANSATRYKNEKIQLLRLRQDFYEAFTRYDESVHAGISILNILDETLSRTIIDSEAMAQRVDDEYNNLMHLIQNENPLDSFFGKEMNNGHKRDQMNVLANMVISAAHIKKELYLWTVLKMSHHTFKNGLADSTSFALIHLGSILIKEFNAYKLGRNVANLGMRLLDKSKSDKYISRTILCYYDLVSHFNESFDSIQINLEKKVAKHMKNGNYGSVNALCRVSVRNQLLGGKAFLETLNTCEKAIEIMPREFSECFGAQLVLTKNSLAKLLSEKELKSETTDAKAIETLSRKKCYFILSEQYVFKSFIHCLLGDYKKAIYYLDENSEFIDLATTQPQVIRQGILRVICEIMLGTSPKKEIVVNLEKLRKKIEPWSIEHPENFRADYELIEFLITIYNHDFSKALLRLEEGIKWSERQGLITVKALLCNLGCNLLPEDNFGFTIKHLKHESQQIFEDWKASIKGIRPDGNSDINIQQQQLNRSSFDTQSLLKATQAISAEVNLGSLVQQLLNIVMENAGADKGALILMKNEVPYLESIVDTNSEKNSSFSEIELQECTQVPVNIIEHVITTRKELSIDDVIKTNYPKESYFRKNGISSLIILPLLKQNDLVGVLHLENRQVKGLFTEGDLEILRVIASQAAISITNTLLYEQSNALNLELSSSKEELAKVNEVLEDRIKKRTEHLQQEIEMRKEAEKNLIYAKNDADKANSAKTQFLANMSHEIRTPLNAIVGFSQILRNQGKGLDLTQKFERYLNNINQSAESLSEVINDILDLSKIEAGKFTIIKEDINLNQIVTSVCRINKGLGKSKEVKLLSNFNDNLPKYIYTDGSKLKQILMNIIGNAIKFTPESKNVYVDVKLEKSFIVFEVEDEGIGIPESQLQQIFNPFIQADAGIDRKYGGTGLGLTITKKLIELLEGKIEVQSQLDQGTLFKIYLPYEQAKNSWIEEKETSLADFKIPPNKKILVVEDNAMNQEMIRALFAELGSEIMLAKNGESGIKITKTYRPEIIFMDVHMPTMDGFETVKRIRKMNNEIPIIGLSADAFTEHREIALNSGFCDYLTKPIQIPELVRVLKKYLSVAIEENTQTFKILSEEDQQVLDHAYSSLNELPIFETEKLVVAAEPLNSILPPDEFNKLEEAIYSGDDEALKILLSNTINAR